MQFLNTVEIQKITYLIVLTEKKKKKVNFKYVKCKYVTFIYSTAINSFLYTIKYIDAFIINKWGSLARTSVI